VTPASRDCVKRPHDGGKVKTIGVLFGMENSFPPALVERINAMKVPGISAEAVCVGGVQLNKPSRYAVIVDRISHDVPFYRAYLKHAAIHGSVIINNPFWWSADDKFFNCDIAVKAGVAVPRTAILPHKFFPPSTTERSMRNLMFPLNWEELFDYVGFPAFMKPVDGGGWRDVYHVHNPDEFFHAYDQSRDLCMMYQRAVNFDEYFRCYVVGQEKVHIMPYNPRRPHHERYHTEGRVFDKKLLALVEKDALALCRALGYDLNTVEFAVEDGVPYAIDFMNPAPDADRESVGDANFEWIINAVAELAIAKAKSAPEPADFHWGTFLSGSQQQSKAKPAAKKKAAAAKSAAKKK
jgi:glutathione synthase/RimK-type ligase-like ATP-grasp enzyme